MPIKIDRREQAALLLALVRWGALGAWVGGLAGIASWAFLAALAWATSFRETHPWLLWLLPLAGAAIALTYERLGKGVEGGNNLLLERIHDPKETVPFRMAPLILVTTVATHLFGGSAGREGTAVQMGGALGQLAVGPLRLTEFDRRMLIMAGIAGGFGSVFGTPLAGAVFALEVLAIGRIGYDALVPCLVASVVGDEVARALGTTHHAYAVQVGPIPAMTPLLFFMVVLAGGLFAAAAIAFSELTHAVQHVAKKVSGHSWVRALAGGGAIVALTCLVDTRDYNGLSLPLIEASFVGRVVAYAFALKILFTAVTLGTGFKGGEVTPLFCIGATLGNAFAQATHQPTGFFAALGFAAVFAGAANTPLACTVMGIELFGSRLAVPLALACVTSYVLSGHRGIYLSQRVRHPKEATLADLEGATLRELRAKHDDSEHAKRT